VVKFLLRDVVKHRDGRVSEKVKLYASLDTIAFKVAQRLWGIDQFTFRYNYVFDVYQENHGSRVYSYLRISNIAVTDLIIKTKTEIGDLFRVFPINLDENGFDFWDNEQNLSEWFMPETVNIIPITRLLHEVMYGIDGKPQVDPDLGCVALTRQNLVQLYFKALEMGLFDVVKAIETRCEQDMETAIGNYLRGCNFDNITNHIAFFTKNNEFHAEWLI